MYVGPDNGIWYELASKVKPMVPYSMGPSFGILVNSFRPHSKPPVKQLRILQIPLKKLKVHTIDDGNPA